MALDKLIIKFINGDESAFDELYEMTRKSVYYTALSVLRDSYLAEDVMQTTYLKVLQNMSGYKLGTNIAAWIVTIAKNEAINLKKTRGREDSVDVADNIALFGMSEKDERGELVDIAKNILDDDEFNILMLVTACGYKRKEIGKMLGIPISTVTWKYNNALKKMREALRGKGG